MYSKEEILKILIEQDGDCAGIDCEDCPFNGISCEIRQVHSTDNAKELLEELRKKQAKMENVYDRLQRLYRKEFKEGDKLYHAVTDNVIIADIDFTSKDKNHLPIVNREDAIRAMLDGKRVVDVDSYPKHGTTDAQYYDSGLIKWVDNGRVIMTEKHMADNYIILDNEPETIEISFDEAVNIIAEKKGCKPEQVRVKE